MVIAENELQGTRNLVIVANVRRNARVLLVQFAAAINNLSRDFLDTEQGRSSWAPSGIYVSAVL
jgi:hypothetical protein